MSSDRIAIVLAQLNSSREYLHSLVDDLTTEQWFWTPADENCCTHIAWQVGHIAMAEYGLMLFRQRGRAEVDLELMPGTFRKPFAKGSQPVTDPQRYPAPEAILAQLDRIHRQVLEEVPLMDDAGLDEPLDPPYAGYATRYGAMLMAVHHEMLHCGQIGLLRRLMGLPPVR